MQTILVVDDKAGVRTLVREYLEQEGYSVVTAENGRPPHAFRWRRQTCRAAMVWGPERIAPEWWLDDPGWRSGPRDYWRVETETGARLWLYEAKGREAPGGWFAQGAFA